MYTTLIKIKAPNNNPLDNTISNRIEKLRDPLLISKFKSLVDAGLVSDIPGENCYIQKENDVVTLFNSTWTTAEAAQEWADFVEMLLPVIHTEVGSINP